MECVRKKDIYAAFDFNVCDMIEFTDEDDSVGGFSREAIEDIINNLPTFFLPDSPKIL